MTAPDLTSPVLLDPDLIEVQAEATAPREYHVRVDVLDAVMPQILAALRDQETRHALNSLRYTVSAAADFPDSRTLADGIAEKAERLAGLLRDRGVGVLHFDSAAAGLLARDISAYPETCPTLNTPGWPGFCENFADTCPAHQDDAAETPRDDR